MMDGYEMLMSESAGIYNPLRKGIFLEVLKYKCTKDFFDIKEGMIIYAHYHPAKFGLMEIDSTKWINQPIDTNIFNEHFEYWDGIIPFFMFSSMKQKDQNKYYKELREMIYYI